MTPDTAIILCASNVFPKLNSTLPSCVRDLGSMYRWYAANYSLSGCPFVALQNERFTKDAFMAAVRNILKNNPTVKKCGIGFSSHGSVVPFNGGNHAVIVTAASDWNDIEGTFIFDSDFGQLATEFPDVRFFITADACESADLVFRLMEMNHTNKFIEAPGDLQLMMAHNETGGAVHKSIAPTLPNIGYVSGTGGKGYYSIDEGDGGAFTKTWIKTVAPKWNADIIANTLDKVMDAQQQPQSHGGLRDQPWLG